MDQETEKTDIANQYHPAFCAAMTQIFEADVCQYEYEKEYNLNSMPNRLDFLIIKKDADAISETMALAEKAEKEKNLQGKKRIRSILDLVSSLNSNKIWMKEIATMGIRDLFKEEFEEKDHMIAEQEKQIQSLHEQLQDKDIALQDKDIALQNKDIALQDKEMKLQKEQEEITRLRKELEELKKQSGKIAVL